VLTYDCWSFLQKDAKEIDFCRDIAAKDSADILKK